MSLRSIVKRLLPPVLADAIRRLMPAQSAGPGEFEVVGTEWPSDTSENPGWADDRIARDQARRWPIFVASIAAPAPLDTPHEIENGTHPNMAFHNTYMCFGYVMGTAARQRTNLSVLDWGGGVGNYYAVMGSMWPDLKIEYHCKDLPAFCREGRRLLPESHFYEDDTCLSRRYDLVMASGSLQCSADWRAVSAGLAAAAGSHLYITRIPILEQHKSLVVRQNAAIHGFNDSLLGWFLNKAEFLAHMESCDVRLVREFLIDEKPYTPAIEETAQYRGFLFEKVDDRQ